MITYHDTILTLFSDAAPENANQCLDILLRNPRGFGRQVILDVAVTAVDGQSRTSDDVADRPLNVRHDQMMAKYHRLADQNGFHFVHRLSFRTLVKYPLSM